MGKGNMDPGGYYHYIAAIRMVQIGQEQTEIYGGDSVAASHASI